MNNKHSLVDTAYEIMTDRYNKGDVTPIPFMELCEKICEVLEISEEYFSLHVSRFYTDMTLDGRFVLKENNTWTLREHEHFENVHIDMNDVYSMDDDYQDEKSDSDSDDDSEIEDFGEKEAEFGERSDDESYSDDNYSESDSDDENDNNE